MIRRLVNVLILSFMCFPFSAHALLTTEAGIANLEWLSFSSTVNQSRQQVDTALNTAGSSLYGYRYATVDEVNLLFTSHYGVDPAIGPWWYSSLATVAEDFYVDFGILESFDYSANNPLPQITTIENSIFPYDTWLRSYFFYGVLDASQNSNVAEVSALTNQGAYGAGLLRGVPGDGFRDFRYDEAYSNTASLLVKNVAPIPEPATMLLFGAGLVGIAGARLRKKKK